jgi:hypothetical protein
MGLEASISHEFTMKKIRKHIWKLIGAFAHPKISASIVGASSQQK